VIRLAVFLLPGRDLDITHLHGSVDQQHPVADPSGALRASKIVPGDFVAALYFR
jgi:hypothetical protein